MPYEFSNQTILDGIGHRSASDNRIQASCELHIYCHGDFCYWVYAEFRELARVELADVAFESAADEYTDYAVYKRLSELKYEERRGFSKTLRRLAGMEYGHYVFWSKYCPGRKAAISKIKVYLIVLIRFMLGVPRSRNSSTAAGSLARRGAGVCCPDAASASVRTTAIGRFISYSSVDTVVRISSRGISAGQ